jgi:SAM-dependent methyltransferase
MSDPAFLHSTRVAYDEVAADYAELFAADLAGQPVKRSLLMLFAELASGPTADVGCGPGFTTAFLHGRGLDVFGVDLSPAMVEQARARHPGVRFEIGSMTGLDHPAQSLGGVNAWFSIIHLPDSELPRVLREFFRVLAPGAPLMLAFPVGDGPQRYREAWGRRVELTFYRRRPETVTVLLLEAGFDVLLTTRHADPGAPGNEAAFLIARRRAVAGGVGPAAAGER